MKAHIKLHIKHIIPALAISFLIFSCSKSDDSPGGGNGSPSTILFGEAIMLTDNSTDARAMDITVDDAGNVYVVGTGWGGSHDVALYWKNGVKHVLTPQSDYGLMESLIATSIVISGNDVFIGGSEDRIAKYWKNGVVHELTDSTENAWVNAIAVSQGNVYAAGGYASHYSIGDLDAAYWKNGTRMTAESSVSSLIRDISISNGDVYAVGYNEISGERKPVYWKNGILNNISYEGEGILTASGIHVNNSDIHIAGVQGKKGIYWKNGETTILDSGSAQKVEVTAMFFDNEDIYISGQIYNGSKWIATYWKNGQPFSLTDGSTNNWASSIFVKDGVVYVSGYEYNGDTNIAKYWKI